MKINIPPDKLKKCCELIGDEYEIRENIDCIQLSTEEIVIQISNGTRISGYKVLYRDFLQLVIEAIEDKEEVFILVWKDDITGLYSWDKSIESVNREVYETRTEAKEQAIIYCLDNMEV